MMGSQLLKHVKYSIQVVTLYIDGKLLNGKQEKAKPYGPAKGYNAKINLKEFEELII